MPAKWLPLEANPGLLTQEARKLGMQSEKVEFHDVLGLDPELLSMVPWPRHAVLLCYPLQSESESESLPSSDTSGSVDPQAGSGLWFSKQQVPNACGTVGLVHALANNVDTAGIDQSTPLGSFLHRTYNMSPSERADAMANDAQLAHAHESTASDGSSTVVSRDAEVDLHFVCFVERNGAVFELGTRCKVLVQHRILNSAMSVHHLPSRFVIALQMGGKRDQSTVVLCRATCLPQLRRSFASTPLAPDRSTLTSLHLRQLHSRH
jgi:ubiquitin carboxyl-terminal hydrolase L3